MRFKVRIWRMLKTHQRIQVLQYRANAPRRTELDLPCKP
ncbi:hypothetical protein SAMN05444972_102206 [Marininema halotolerans]|uniref:Uncharacterized protein n=1 Tax=Marininema halotolerans TaxID=1155944 RepID=A0A1I6PXX9_9BACL|nr:hypothetical protein SAMN05444972_102206 [Marininema halotolerans]